MDDYTQLPDISTISNVGVVEYVEYVGDVITGLSLEVSELEEMIERAKLTLGWLERQGYSPVKTCYYKGHIANLENRLNVCRYDFRMYLDAYRGNIDE